MVALAGCAAPEVASDADVVTSLYALVETVDGVAFFPPLGPDPTTSGTFDATLLPELRVLLERTDGSGAVSTVATFDATTTPRLRLVAEHEVYFVDVPALAHFTDPSASYRFRVLLGAAELGRSDLSSRVFGVLEKHPNLTVGVKVRAERRPAPTIARLAPSETPRAGGDLVLTVTGAGFASDSIVHFADRALATTKVSSTVLTAVVPAALLVDPGRFDVVVVTPPPGGGASAAAAFSVFDPTPVLTALSPASATAASAPLVLTLDGAWFVPSSVVVREPGVPLATTFVSASRLFAELPADTASRAGSYALHVENPTGAPSTSATFTVVNPVPSITSIAPTSADVGAVVALTVIGQGFSVQSSIVVDGVASATTYVGPGELRATLDAGALGALHTVLVTSPAPGGGTSAPAIFTVNNRPAVITQLTPSSAVAGSGALTLTIDGSFVRGATATFDGAPLSVTFVSGTRLTAPLTAAQLSAAGAHAVVASNPAPGGGASTSATFTLSVPTAQVLAFAQQPPFSARPSTDFTTAPIVQAQDTSGRLATGFTGAITLAAYSDATCSTPATGVFTVPTNPRSAVAGQATFAGIQYNTTGTIYLQATAAGLTSACSSSVVVSSSCTLTNGFSQASWITKCVDIPGIAVGYNASGTKVVFVGAYNGLTGSCSTNYGGGTITELNPTTGAVVATHASPSGGWGTTGPAGLAWDPAGYLWVASYNDYRIYRVRVSNWTIVSSFATNSTVGRALGGLAYDGTNLWVSNGSTTYKLSTTGASLGTYAAVAQGLEFGAGYLWTMSGGVISARDSAYNVVRSYSTTGIASQTGDIGLDPITGTIFFGQRGTSTLYQFHVLDGCP